MTASYILQDNTSELNIKYWWRAPFEYLISKYETSQLLSSHGHFVISFINTVSFLKNLCLNKYSYKLFKYLKAFLKLLSLMRFALIFNIFLCIRRRFPTYGFSFCICFKLLCYGLMITRV